MSKIASTFLTKGSLAKNARDLIHGFLAFPFANEFDALIAKYVSTFISTYFNISIITTTVRFLAYDADDYIRSFHDNRAFGALPEVETYIGLVFESFLQIAFRCADA